MNFTAAVHAIRSEQSGLQGDEGYGVSCADCSSQSTTGIGIKPARYIQRQHRNAELVDALDKLRVAAFEPAFESNTEQTVHHQVPFACGDFAVQNAAGFSPQAQSASGVAGQFFCIPGENDVNFEPPLLEMAGEDQCITAVIARSGNNQHAGAARTQQFAREFGGGEARCFHQAMHRQKPGFDFSDVASQVNRPRRCSVFNHGDDSLAVKRSGG